MVGNERRYNIDILTMKTGSLYSILAVGLMGNLWVSQTILVVACYYQRAYECSSVKGN